MTRERAEEILHERFGITEFYDEQWAAIDRLLKGERVLMIQRTGFGKSLVFQFAGMLLEGTTVIFSPLIALMREQVNKLKDINLPAAYINSTLTIEEKKETLRKAERGEYKLLYIAPERLADQKWQQVLNNMKLGMVVVDEAHCISSWGHDFRPNYHKIVNVVRMLKSDLPVLACTATATTRVQSDIEAQFDNSRMTVIRGKLGRDNFWSTVVSCETREDKMAGVLKLVESLKGTGIIYCGTRAESEIYSQWLEFNGISAASYHAGLDNETRKRIEVALMNNKYRCIVSTNALGMGMDKPDIRFVIHTQIPVSPLHYIQETGRAGRDGLPTTIALFYSPQDDQLPLSFIHNSKPPVKKYEQLIELLKREPLSWNAVIKALNLKQNAVKIILNDLTVQGIISREKSGSSFHYELMHNAPRLNVRAFEEVRKAKLADFERMKGYMERDSCRMNYLRQYLGDTPSEPCGKCDVDLDRRFSVSASEDQLDIIRRYRESCFPVLELETKTGILANGVAASYYGVANTGTMIHQCKIENRGDFPEHLLRLTLKAFRAHYKPGEFDLIMYVPPTVSGNQVMKFAGRIAEELGIRLSHGLVKVKPTKPQRAFESSLGRRKNLKGAFRVGEDVKKKRILLVDDIMDSGATIREIASVLKSARASMVGPLVIVKSTGSQSDKQL
ncbi:MAG: RecQ family ATP-dependent DNA helicase [Bacteroidales bacterium]|nr:RecQ family ATP-dependent DNA helicase [Bacteroidales bacterium]